MARFDAELDATNMRVLFIDFDGVLHPSEQADASRLTHFCWLSVLVDALRSHSDVRIVVHSTWRYMYDDDELRMLLGPLGNQVVGSTGHGPRFESIRGWLYANKACKSYRILDDDATDFPVPPPDELVLCNPSTGVAAQDVRIALSTWLKASASCTAHTKS